MYFYILQQVTYTFYHPFLCCWRKRITKIGCSRHVQLFCNIYKKLFRNLRCIVLACSLIFVISNCISFHNKILLFFIDESQSTCLNYILSFCICHLKFTLTTSYKTFMLSISSEVSSIYKFPILLEFIKV